MKLVKSFLSVIGIDSASASVVEDELQEEDKSLATLLEEQNHCGCQKTKC